MAKAREEITNGKSSSLNGYILFKEKELKPCPFCGETEIEIDNTHTPYYWCQCTSCGCEVNSPGRQEKRFAENHLAAIDSAVIAWNTRVK